jgi:hypothetical protein
LGSDAGESREGKEAQEREKLLPVLAAFKQQIISKLSNNIQFEEEKKWKSIL